jgi:energy-coupling factor transport system substrate-specific component
MQLLLVKDRYLEMTVPMMGEEYAKSLERLVTYPNMGLVYLGAILGGIIGACIGRVFLKKHFAKAGIV